jgi:transcriptional accessory protein Tex/SPT6
MLRKEEAMAMKKIRSMVNSYKIDAISIGNGTASRETEFFIKKIAFDKPIQILLFQKPELQCIQHLKLRVKSSQIMM